MLAPLSWLKEFVDIKLTPEELAKRLTEVGLGCEKISKVDGDVIFELEITPNRPDWLSIIGIAREIAAIEGKKVKLDIKGIPQPNKELALKVHNDFTILERYNSVIIDNATIKDSPGWLKKRLTQVGLRPINNVVDITNYVMFELGIPLHAFDYEQIYGKEFFIEKSKGGEKFTTVDNITYSLPRNAIIIRDRDRVVDLVGIKGGANSGITAKTKTVLLQTSVDNPVLVRRASLAIGLRSDASNILEKGLDKEGLLPALNRAANLILDLAGGTIASEVIDLKKQDFKSWKVKLNHQRLLKILGIDITPVKVKSLLDRLGLTTNYEPKTHNYIVTIPTYRNDLQIEEDIMEEVARLYGYNNFPKTLPIGETPTKQIPYFKDHKIEQKAKQILTASGFSEIYTYSLVSEKDLAISNFNPDHCLRVDNPVSREFEYLRPSLTINLKKALEQNKPNAEEINLFELGKIYLGKTLDKTEEPYYLSGISNTKNFLEVKGVLKRLFWELDISKDPTDFIHPLEDYVLFELNFTDLVNKNAKRKIYKPIPKYPPIIEDVAFIVSEIVGTGDIINAIKNSSSLISQVSLLDTFENTRTFHIVYQHPQKNLTNDEIKKVKEKFIKLLQNKFDIRVKG